MPAKIGEMAVRAANNAVAVLVFLIAPIALVIALFLIVIAAFWYLWTLGTKDRIDRIAAFYFAIRSLGCPTTKQLFE